MEEARRGNLDAREEWVASWWPRVYRMALAMTGNEADAEDLAQETLMAALAALKRFRGDSSESTWLYAILLRKFRRSRRRPLKLAAPNERPAGLEKALSVLSRLPAAQRITAALFYLEDMTIKEIATSLGVPRATVRWRLFRARRTLRGRSSGTVWKEIL